MKIIKVLMDDAQVAGAFTFDKAMEKARIQAGRNSQHVRRGDKWGYKGNYGFAYINEPEARKFDEENSSDVRHTLITNHSYRLNALDGTPLCGSVSGKSILQVAADFANNRKEAVVIVSDASDTKKVVHPSSKT